MRQSRRFGGKKKYRWGKYVLVTTQGAGTISTTYGTAYLGATTPWDTLTLYDSCTVTAASDGTLSYTLGNRVTGASGLSQYAYTAPSRSYNGKKLSATRIWEQECNGMPYTQASIEWNGTAGAYSYSQGDYIEDVYSYEDDTFPENGKQDGYWYVRAE